MNITELLQAGFTTEELIEKGILVVNTKQDALDEAKEQKTETVSETKQEQETLVEKPVETVETVDISAINATIQSAFADLSKQLTEAIQKANLKNVTGSGDSDKQLTLDEAINNIVSNM